MRPSKQPAITISAWRTLGKSKHKWDSRSFAAGLLVGAGLAVGVILFVELLLFDVNTIGLGLLLAAAATFVLRVFAKAGSL